ncbi:MAG: flagellar export protein FliJ [Lachnospiraceae bacterium]|jgi:flagellar FliJ protein|nr:flagellar export protein FliJ [Lachnospiraceae bacterium]
MKKFIYPMQSILNLQYKIEDQQKAAFREANNKLQEEQDLLERLILQQNTYESDLKELMSDVLDIPAVRSKKHEIDIMKSRVRSQMFQVHMAEKNVEAARIRLTQAMIDRKTQERMKEKAFDAYKVELAQEESKEIDQLVSYKHSV